MIITIITVLNTNCIQSTEFDARKECTDFLVNKFLALINQSNSSNIKNPYQVSRYLAAIVVAEAEMVSSGEAEAGPEFFSTMQELVYFINYLQNRTITHFTK
ncbi:MAG: hypothetical protein IJP00_00720 [Firmicutes bacterium]|nr:hypothetical protein [Bacillota bacterium]